MDQLKHVLDGFKVLDFTQVSAGPTATRMMAEMGAEVIKVELAQAGDASRALPFIKDGRSAYYIQQNRGKKSLCIDLKDQEGVALIKELIPKMDVLIENFAPGVIKRLGFDYEVVSAMDRIVMCSVVGLGQSGPFADRPGYDTVGAAYAGVVVDMCGCRDRAPVMPAFGLAMSVPGFMRWPRSHGPFSPGHAPAKASSSGRHLLDCYFGFSELDVADIQRQPGRLPGQVGAVSIIS